MHINNLYKDQRILEFKEVYALEKIHGTSAHIRWNNGEINFFSGDENHKKFVKLFDQETLKTAFQIIGHPNVTVYGEAYGGKQQGMRETYGAILHFIVFDIKVEKTWLNVLNAEDVTNKLGLEFVPYEKVFTDISTLNAERDRFSRVAVRRGCKGDKLSEGVVLRPLNEYIDSREKRVICKHKREAFNERKTQQKIVDPERLKVLTEAKAIAEEWVTPMRLEHVLQQFSSKLIIEDTPAVIRAMTEDVLREADTEIIDSKAARSAIAKMTAILFKKRFQILLNSSK